MRNRNRLPYGEIARRITGISTPFFGISWTPPEDKRNIVRRLITALEDRRVLYAEDYLEFGPWVIESVHAMRSELTQALKEGPEDEAFTSPVRAMRAACRKFLNDIGSNKQSYHRSYSRREVMLQALGELRAIIGLNLAHLCAAYGVDAEADLASIFPVADQDTDL